MDCLVAVLDSHREDALTCFQLQLRGADPLFGARHVECSLGYAMYRDYLAVQPILLQMLKAATPRAVESAAKLLALAGIVEEWVMAQSDATRVLEMGVHARRGAAEVYAQHVLDSVIEAQGRKLLMRLFDNFDAGVREEAPAVGFTSSLTRFHTMVPS